MKKLTLALALCGCFAIPAAALNITDPLFMPQQGAVTAETAVNITNNAFKLGDSYGLNQNITVGIADNLSVGASVGWAKIKHEHSGMQDPVLNARYRFLDGSNQNIFLDLQGYISPEFFDSPFNNDGGSAKGSTDFGLHSIVGSTELAQNFTFAARTGFDYIGSTNAIDSGSIWSLGGTAKYYINDTHSLQADAVLKAYLGFEGDFGGYGCGINYAWQVVPESISLIPFASIEARDNGDSAYKNWGLKVKYLF